MKQTILTFFLLSAIVIASSCRKNNNQLNITQYDQQQIQNYIAANHLTGFVQDSTGGDTSGIYYKIIQRPTTDTALAYSDNISFVFTLRSFDGKYVSADTIANHYQGYLGHVVTDALPFGLELAIINDLKHYGGSMRVLIPSRLAYGINGYGSGSSTVASNHIAGNQCLDYYVHVINARHDSLTAARATQLQAKYDYQVINSYINNNSLAGLYALDTLAGVYWRITTPSTTGNPDQITNNSSLEVTYSARTLNTVFYDEYLGADSVALQIPDQYPGVQSMLKKHGVQGETISMIMPSTLAGGTNAIGGNLATAPVNSCLRFEYTILTVSP